MSASTEQAQEPKNQELNPPKKSKATPHWYAFAIVNVDGLETSEIFSGKTKKDLLNILEKNTDLNRVVLIIRGVQFPFQEAKTLRILA